MSARLLPAACCLAAVVAATDVAAQPPAAPVLRAARDGLDAVAAPDAGALEAAVAEHLAEARREFERAAADSSLSRSRLADAYGALARVYHAYEFFSPAETAYVNALRLDPRDARWLHLLGYLYQQTGRFEAAAPRLSMAVRVKPSDRAAALRLGDVSLELGRLQDARLQFEALLDVFPAAARRGLGEVALREGRYRDAVEYLRGALERAPQADALHYRLAMAYRGLGNVDQARAELEKRGPRDVIAADPVVDPLAALARGERLLVIRGTRAYAAGQFREAADAFERALAVSPGSVPAHVNLSSTLLQLGDVPRAIEQMQAAYAQAPEGVEESLVSLALLLSEREWYADAIALLDGAERRVPGRRSTATTLARLLASSPNLSLRDGRRALALAMAVYEADGRAVHAETVALALAELGRCSDAMEWMRRALSAAESESDSEELTRLGRELPRYQGAACRAPGK